MKVSSRGPHGGCHQSVIQDHLPMKRDMTVNPTSRGTGLNYDSN